MGRWAEGVNRIDGLLGRLVFRSFGLVFALVALGMAYGAWNHLSSNRPFGWTPVILFALIALAAGSCVPYCFSRRRTMAEALNAMEDSTPDFRKRDPR